ncbi:MAG: gliding motility-associated C-terminal domain-containing protein [Bacteroidetes bacterium]|nr:gliding motility-associated C-terminal domain-containing protein [Bacteroidota bacterium]MBI3483243.1 gliding motility-associated C-terminal domain-containing protein [Bacteroidota bacterium]
MRKAFLLVGLTVLGFAVKAQPYTSRLGRFQVDQIRGCAPFTINITNTNLSGNGGCTAGTPCVMSFDGTNSCPPNASCQNAIQFTYNTPGTYKLTVTYQNTGPDDITVTVDPNIQPAFDIYTCAGSQVSINITDKTYDSYNIDFNNDGTIDKSIPSGNNQTATFAYGTPGNRNISVKGQKLNAANNCSPKVQAFMAIAALPTPSINSLTATDASTLQLAFTPQTNIEYKSEIAFNNGTNFQTYQTLYQVNSMTASNLNVNGSYYCFRLSSFDPCANTNSYSLPVCSHNFSLALASGSDQLSWLTNSTGVSNILIKRDNSPLVTVASNSSSYNDNAVVCKTNYCYQLVSNYTGGATSTSLQKCGTAFNNTTPTAIINTSAGVNGTQVDLTWLQDPAFKAASYDVARSPIGGQFALENKVTTTKYSDVSYGAGGYCYKINYSDACDNLSPDGLISCPIRLNGSLDPSNNVNLNWSSYKGWNKGVKEYTVQKHFQQGAPQTIYVGPDSSFVDQQQDLVNQSVYYKITATPIEAGVTSSVSNEIKIVKNVNLFYPSAFNPESKMSTLNKTFLVKGHYIASMKLQIFDRWGSLVFYSDKDEAWDGKRDGTAMPDATYVWTAEGIDLTGNAFKKAGTVLLIRK